MLRFAVRRLLSLIPVLLLVSALTFFGLQLVPGDPISVLLGPGAEVQLSPAEYHALLHQNGLDKPLPARYLDYLGNLLHGDLGRSRITHQRVADMLKERYSVSVWLNVITFTANLVMGLALGTIAGLFHGSKIDLAATMLAVVSVATPGFWIAILLIVVFALKLGWLPAAGWIDPLAHPGEGIKHLVLPVISLGVFGSASIMRQTRSSLVEVVRQDYVTTARSKGLRERSVVVRHMLKNAMIPIVTLLGFQIAGLLGGSVLIEQVFGLPGVGRMALQATQTHDYQVVMAVVMLAAIAIVLANLIADVLYGVLDPRIRLR